MKISNHKFKKLKELHAGEINKKPRNIIFKMWTIRKSQKQPQREKTHN